MSPGPDDSPRGVSHSRWFIPTFSVALGVIMLAAISIGGHPGSGLGALGVMIAVGVVFLIGGRSETIRGLRDERFAMIDLKATAAAGGVLILTVTIAFLVEVAKGRNGNPYTWLDAIAGLAYMLAIGVLRWRS